MKSRNNKRPRVLAFLTRAWTSRPGPSSPAAPFRAPHGATTGNGSTIAASAAPTPNPEFDRVVHAIDDSGLFDEEYYARASGAEGNRLELIRHYLSVGEARLLAPSADFDLAFYRETNPDVDQSGMSALVHYVRYGRREGRQARRPTLARFIVPGGRSHDPAKPTIVVASHEASRTGAPMVGLMVGAQLAERCNVIVALGDSGAMAESFLEYSCMGLIGKPSAIDAECFLTELQTNYGVEALVVNSVEAGNYAVGALHAGIPTVALLHEFPEYTLPAGRMAAVVLSADRVIVPSELVRESLQREVTTFYLGPANNVTVRPQGYLPSLPRDHATDLTRDEIYGLLKIDDPAATKIVLGAGYVQLRKGVDLFVQTAAEVRALWGDDVRFVWVGDGYSPTDDLHYSVWLADMVRRLDLEDHVFFVGHQSSLATLFRLSDAFYLPSRLDPFPNVVVDALMAGKPVVCFDRATGVADLFRDGVARGAAVEYCDVHAAARSLVEVMQPADPQTAKAAGYASDARFDFQKYVAFIGEQIETAKLLRQNVTASVRRIEASGAFDAAFHNGTLHGSDVTARRATFDYAVNGTKGLAPLSPRAGFSEGLYWSQHPGALRDRPALDHALTFASPSADPPTTHRCIALADGPAPDPFTGRAALHVHLHYSELAPEFLERLTVTRCRADLFITTTSAEKRLEIEHTFRDYALGAMHVVEVPNLGRDIGPLVSALRTRLRAGGYDVIGHLHGKRTVAIGGGIGDRWRNYLLGTLLGDHDGLQRIFSIFASDPKVGLVFAEDRHCQGWTKNKRAAELLAERMTPRPELPDFPVFPLGSMFWARPAVLEPFWGLGLDIVDFPREPLPYDGSMLHAIERLVPAVCEAAGYSWCTVYHDRHVW